ncbi:MAG: TIGR03790 family protein [Planctomycetota bacterium]
MRTLFTWLALALPAAAQISPDQVLVVVNDASDVSRAIGEYYVELRDIPPGNVFHLPPWTPTDEEIIRPTYNTFVRDPLIEFLTVERPELREHIKLIVTTKGVPLMVWHPEGGIFTSPRASVDSELTQLFTGRVPDGGQGGRVGNPYLGVDQPFAEFSHSNISYLVFRLTSFDGPVDSVTLVPIDLKRLLDRSQHPARDGVFVFDLNTTKKILPDKQMIAAARMMRDLGFEVIEDRADPMLANVPGILGYFSWGSNDPFSPPAPYWGEVPPGSGQIYPGAFVAGAVSHTYVSSNARTFTRGNENYGQSLIAGLIHHGVSAASGHVYEPNADAVTNCELLLRALAKGYTLGEAYYQGVPLLSWMTVVVCDPLTTYDFRPELHAVMPGQARIGDTITLSGWGFTSSADSTVTIGGAPATTVQVVNGQTLTVTVPAIPIGQGPSQGGGPSIGPKAHRAGQALDITLTNTRGEVTLEQSFIPLPARK